MKPHSATKIDYWIGIPICFLLSMLDKIRRVFIKKREKCLYKKIMFIELSEMGAAILGYSAIKKARQMYPDSKVYFLIFKENVESVYILDIISRENVLTIRSKNLWVLLTDTIKAIIKIRREKIDVVIDMELFSRFASILTYLSGAKTKVGFYKFSLEGLYRGDFYTHKVIYNPYIHISKNFLTLVYSLKLPYKDAPTFEISLIKEKTEVPRIRINKLREENIWKKIKENNKNVQNSNKLVVLNLGLGEFLPLRKWPLENYIKLAGSLLRIPDIFVVLISLQFEYREVLKTILNSPRCINLIKKLSFRELIDLFNISDLLITHDGGTVNIASLANINTIALFGPETPLLYEPLSANKRIIYKNHTCSPCFSAHNHRYSMCKNNVCLKTINVEEVYREACRYLCIASPYL